RIGCLLPRTAIYVCKLWHKTVGPRRSAIRRDREAKGASAAVAESVFLPARQKVLRVRGISMNVRLGLSSRLRESVRREEIIAETDRVNHLGIQTGRRVDLGNRSGRFHEIGNGQQAAREPRFVHSLTDPFAARKASLILKQISLSPRAGRQRKGKDQRERNWILRYFHN